MKRRSTDRAALALSALALSGCSWLPWGKGSPDNEPTLKTLAARKVDVAPDAGVKVGEAQAIEAYKQFLAITEGSPRAGQRAEAMRRIGDLEMELAEAKSASSPAGAAPDYRAAIERYRQSLKTWPNDPGNDRILYQLSRAHEQGGDLETALKTLDELVAKHPNTRYADEAQFRRGELLFTAKNYAGSEKAFAVVLAAGDGNPYRDRALYMHGWSLYKQGRLEDGLRSFFGVLDGKLAGRSAGDETLDLDGIAGLSRADRELVEDTFRVTSISLSNLQGAESIPSFLDTPERKRYAFRVYQQLGELYLKQERSKDAADVYAAFAQKNPLDAQAPVLQARVIEIYEKSGFGAQALAAKKQYVSAYGRASDFKAANPEGWQRAQPLVLANLTELARHHHASAQQTKGKADVDEAVRWYRELLASFPSDKGAAQNDFLLAELLYENGRFAEAGVEYEKTAYAFPAHAKSADAGYAALLSYAQQVKAAPAAEKPTLQRAGVDSALRFATAFPADARDGPVLADAAETLYGLKDGPRASKVAEQVVALQPPAPEASRRVAWTVIGHAAFESGGFDRAETAYAETLKLVPANDAARADLVERQAAAIYKQGEAAKSAGKPADAVAAFARVATVAPQSPIRATAQFDSAATLIGMKDWDGATKSLEDFRARYPNHPLQGDVGGKLALAYTEQGQWAKAAGEYERFAANAKEPAAARQSLWQAAEFYEKASARPQATKAYERYVQQNPQPLEPAVEARFKLAAFARADGQPVRETAWTKEILQADRQGGAGRTPRTRFLGASAALALAEPVAEQYRQIALTEPLQQKLKLKKQKMEEALKAYSEAAEYGIADVTTAATFRIATIYRDMGKALLASERPKKLSKVEREQYDVLLEEQAFPFEEKAIELHEVNAKRAAQGIYDRWVQQSFAALRELKPVRYGKNEVAEGVVDAIR